MTTVSTLGEVADWVSGISFKPEQKIEPFSHGSVVCFTTRNIQSRLDEDNLTAVSRTLVKRQEQFVKEGDILISTANSWELVGKSAWVPALQYEATIGAFISLVRPRPKRILPRFLFHWITSAQTQHKLRHLGRQTTNISNLDKHRSLELLIPLPPLAEQRRIAAILDKVDELHALRQRALARLDDLAQSVFFEMFGGTEKQVGWRETTIGELCFVKGGKRLPKGHSYSPQATPYQYLRVLDFKDGEVELGSLNYLYPETYAHISRYTVNEGDVVISIAGTIGATMPIHKELQGVNLTENAAKLVARTPGKYTPDFLSFLLRMPHLRNQIHAQTGQVTIGKLALFRIEGIKLLLPPLTMQRKFDEFYKARMKLVKKSRNSLKQIELLKQALNKQLFLG